MAGQSEACICRRGGCKVSDPLVFLVPPGPSSTAWETNLQASGRVLGAACVPGWRKAGGGQGRFSRMLRGLGGPNPGGGKDGRIMGGGTAFGGPVPCGQRGRENDAVGDSSKFITLASLPPRRRPTTNSFTIALWVKSPPRRQLALSVSLVHINTSWSFPPRANPIDYSSQLRPSHRTKRKRRKNENQPPKTGCSCRTGTFDSNLT